MSNVAAVRAAAVSLKKTKQQGQKKYSVRYLLKLPNIVNDSGYDLTHHFKLSCHSVYLLVFPLTPKFTNLFTYN